MAESFMAYDRTGRLLSMGEGIAGECGQSAEYEWNFCQILLRITSEQI
jgi:hypothetical protein